MESTSNGRGLSTIIIQHDQDECEKMGQTIRMVTQRMIRQKQGKKYLEIYGKSLICDRRFCTRICRMFQNMRRHMELFPQEKKCNVFLMNGALMRSHMWWCKDKGCPVPDCPVEDVELNMVPCMCGFYFDLSKDYYDVHRRSHAIKRRMCTQQKYS